MKKNILSGVLMLLCVIIASCSADEDELQKYSNNFTGTGNVCFNFECNKNLFPNQNTRASLTSDGKVQWEQNDTIGIFPVTTNGNINDAIIYIIASDDSEHDGDYFAPEVDGNSEIYSSYNSFYAFYPYRNGISDYTSIPVDYTGQVQAYITSSLDQMSVVNSTGHIKNCDYLYTSSTDKDDEGNIVFAFKRLSKLMRFNVRNLPMSHQWDSVSLASRRGNRCFIKKANFDITTEMLTPVEKDSMLTLGISRNICVDSYGGDCIFYMAMYMDDTIANEDLRVIFTDSNGSKYFVDIDAFDYSYGEFVTCNIDCTNMYVDLGLPSGTMWSVFNVGSTYEYGEGKYYAWGEIYAAGEQSPNNYNNYWYNSNSNYGSNMSSPYTRSFYCWETYEYGSTSQTYPYNRVTKYCVNSSYWGATESVVFKSKLDPIDDAAFQNMSSKWRMPTVREFSELVSRCDWVESYSPAGHFVQSKSTNNRIFIPKCQVMEAFGGYRDHCFYWASEIESNMPSTVAGCLRIDHSSRSMVGNLRSIGLPVRAVYNR